MNINIKISKTNFFLLVDSEECLKLLDSSFHRRGHNFFLLIFIDDRLKRDFEKLSFGWSLFKKLLLHSQGEEEYFSTVIG